MSATIVTDRSKNIHWIARKGDDQSITINFLDEDDNPFDISEEDFTFLLRRFGGGTILTLVQDDGITNGGASGVLTISFTHDQLEIQADPYFLLLKSVNGSDRVMTWLNGNYTLNGEEYDGDTTEEATIQVNQGDVVLNLTVTIGSGGDGGSFEIEEYTAFEADGLPTDVPAGYIAQLKFADTDYQETIGGVQYFHNKIIYYTGTNWISWSGDYGTTT